MPINDLSDHDKEVLAAAYLSAQNYTALQALAIFRENGIGVTSEPAFGRRVKEAEDRGWLQHIVPEELFSPDIMTEIREMTCRRGLEDKLKGLSPRLRSVSVFYSGSQGTRPEDWDIRLKYHSAFAARKVVRLLEQSQNVGVAWGHQVASIVSALASIGVKKALPKIRFIPTSGEPLRGPSSSPERGSTSLVAQLHRRFGNESERPLSLAGVAAVISDVFEGAAREAVLRYIHDLGDYRRIFLGTESTEPLVSQIDTMLASVGSLDQGWTMYQSALVQTGGISRERLTELVAGDIAGALVKTRKRKLSPGEENEFLKIVESWSGICITPHLLSIATNAISTGKPGVVVVAIGKNKANILLEVLKMGLINELIIDHDLADAL